MDTDRQCQRFKIILWTVSMCLLLTRSTADDNCPTNCDCEDVSAICTNLQVLPDNFPDRIVNITITQSTFMTLGPLVLGGNARHIVIRDTEITSIGENFLRDCFAPLTLEFSTIEINTIASRAFSNIQNLISLSFYTASIGSIEEEAFTDFSAIGQISIKRTNIIIIKAGAFRNISVSKFMLTDCEIGEIETASFHSLHVSDIMTLNDVTFRRMKKEAFTNVKEIRKVYIENCRFLAMECNAIMGLREATSKHSDSFYFNNSSLPCDCSAVSLFKYVQRNPHSVTETVLCFPTNKNSNLSGPVLKVMDTYQKVCLHKLTNACKEDLHQDATSTYASPKTELKPEVLTSTKQEEAQETTVVAMSQSSRTEDIVSSDSAESDEVVEAAAVNLPNSETKSIGVMSQMEILVLFMSMFVYFTYHHLET